VFNYKATFHDTKIIRVSDLYGPNTVIVGVSGNKDDLGKIFIANKRMQTVYGHDPEKMINLNVDMLMPKMVAKHHREYMTACVETGKLVAINKERELYGVNAKGYAFPMKLLITLDVSLHSG
jgi:PAS domain S-box